MIELRPFDSLGTFRNEWLHARYHFSFSEYHDPRRMGWGLLRVWNDDTIRARSGFPLHGHRDMEIITYVRKGAISHEDSLGNRGRTAAGDVQVMSAGSGIRHAEFNQEDEDTLLFQIWIETAQKSVAPHWGTRRFPAGERAAKLVPLASGREGHGDALPIHQDAAILGATLAEGHEVVHPSAGRRAYLVPSRGAVMVNGVAVDERSGAAIAEEKELRIKAVGGPAEIVLADVP